MTDMIATILNITPYAVIEHDNRRNHRNIATSSKSNPRTIIIIAMRFFTIP